MTRGLTFLFSSVLALSRIDRQGLGMRPTWNRNGTNTRAQKMNQQIRVMANFKQILAIKLFWRDLLYRSFLPLPKTRDWWVLNTVNLNLTSNFACFSYSSFICRWEWSDAGATAALCDVGRSDQFHLEHVPNLISKGKKKLVNEAGNTVVFLCRVLTANVYW